MWSRPEDLKAQLAIERVFEPKCSRDQAQSKLAAWETAVRSTQLGLVESAADH
jgi:glycerol kinase